MSRIKREVASPEEIETNAIGEKAADLGEAVESVAFEGSIDGRALKQSTQSITKIDVGVQSQLLVTPGSSAIIYFEVTNLRDQPTYHNFNVQDEKRYLIALEPRL